MNSLLNERKNKIHNAQKKLLGVFLMMKEILDYSLSIAQTLPSSQKNKELYEKLKQLIEHLIKNDFNQLVQLLYRIDVSEQKLNDALASNPNTEPAEIITQLIILRQQEKLKWREWYKNNQ